MGQGRGFASGCYPGAGAALLPLQTGTCRLQAGASQALEHMGAALSAGAAWSLACSSWSCWNPFLQLANPCPCSAFGGVTASLCLAAPEKVHPANEPSGGGRVPWEPTL